MLDRYSMRRRKYHRARTLRERRRRALIGTVGGVLLFILALILLGILSLLSSDSALYRPLLYTIILGIPLVSAFLIEWWVGTHPEE